MAARLVERGHELVVWNRSSGRAAAMGERGARVATSPAGAACEIVLTVLPDLPQVQEVLAGPRGLLAGWRARNVEHPILVIHGTTSPVETAVFAERMLRDEGVVVVDAPVSGGTVGAAAGTLSVMVGADAEATVDRLRPVFSAYGALVTRFGPSGAGALAKACNQIVVASTVAAIAEALALAERGGLDRSAVLDVLAGGLAGSEVLRQKRGKWEGEDFAEGGSARNQVKDLRFVEAAARRWHLDLPAVSAVTGLFQRMVDEGNGDLDHTGVILTLSAAATERS
jgi:2-hydroxy-3-oxopropionate reductase